MGPKRRPEKSDTSLSVEERVLAAVSWVLPQLDVPRLRKPKGQALRPSPAEPSAVRWRRFAWSGLARWKIAGRTPDVLRRSTRGFPESARRLTKRRARSATG